MMHLIFPLILTFSYVTALDNEYDLRKRSGGHITPLAEEVDDVNKMKVGQKARMRLTELTMYGPENDPQWVDKTWGSYEAYQSMDPVIKLTDDSFEHDTQVSTGMTTGPWFVMFSAAYCKHCNDMMRDWTQLAIDVKGEVNIALVDAPFQPLTTRRFNVTMFPTIFYFRDKKMYTYPPRNSRYWRDLALFVRTDYEQFPTDEIPPPHTSFDEVVENVQNFLISMVIAYETDPWNVLAFALLGLAFSLSIPALYVFRHGFVWDAPPPLFPPSTGKAGPVQWEKSATTAAKVSNTPDKKTNAPPEVAETNKTDSKKKD